MKSILVVVGFVLFVVVAGGACSNPADNDPFGEHREPQMPSQNMQNIKSGEDLFKTECEVCHGPGGKKSMKGMKTDAADLTSEKVQKKTDAELKTIIRKGKPGNPEMAGHPWLSDAEIDRLIQFIRALK